MNPVWFELRRGTETWVVHAYPAMHAIAAVVTLILGCWSLRRESGLLRSLALIVPFLATLELASRYAYRGLTAIGPLQLPAAGLWLPAGIAAGLITLIALSRWLRLDPWRVADQLAPPVYLGGALIRGGCWFRGCCFGHETQLAWGIRFPLGSPAHIDQGERNVLYLLLGPAPVHPTQIIDASACLLIAAISAGMLRHRMPKGSTSLLAGALFALTRAGVTLLRVPDARLPAWTQSAWLTAILGLGLGFGALCVLRGKSTHVEDQN